MSDKNKCFQHFSGLVEDHALLTSVKPGYVTEYGIPSFLFRV